MGTISSTNDFTTDYNYMAIGLERIAYGKLFFTGYSGILYAYDDKTGDLLWTYGNGGAGNSTLSGFETPYGRYPTFISVIADGKVYIDTTEHSPNSPLYKGAMYRAINATDGTELWKIMDYGNQMYGGQAVVADGYLSTQLIRQSNLQFRQRTQRSYRYSTRPSSFIWTTNRHTWNSNRHIAGTKQDEQAARFPNGVPAVSDASQSEWMEYVYMQKPMPTSTTGVPVSIDVVDSTATSATLAQPLATQTEYSASLGHPIFKAHTQ